jgi:nickel-dependent lactate racemase
MGDHLTQSRIGEIIEEALPGKELAGKRVLLIVPDATRSCPLGSIFKEVHRQLHGAVAALDVMIALGTHPPMSEEAICERLEITPEERRSAYASVQFLNHEWDNPAALRRIGTLSAEETEELSGGHFSMEVPVDINARLFDYDEIVIIGPVFPHEVVGFSGGNKYLFPGVGGPEILNFFHWLGAVVTNPMIIGHKWTPVRKVVDRAAALLTIPKHCLCMVVDKGGLAGLFAGTPEEAWDQASELSRQLHITYKPRPFHTILSCAPAMYDELWVGGKCMYKLEPVLADDGELIIYAPHIHEISVVHGKLIEEIGYHCRDYFLGQWDRFKDYPWGIVAHSTHVRGIGTYENGVERCRARVTLATGIPKEVCERINMGYRDPASINPSDYADREEEGILLVPKAGEMLYQLEQPADWASGVR